MGVDPTPLSRATISGGEVDVEGSPEQELGRTVHYGYFGQSHLVWWSRQRISHGEIGATSKAP